jgi:hypothetical protein
MNAGEKLPSPGALTNSAKGVVSLPYLFDRPRNGHPWLHALSELERSSVIGEPQVIANWRMDHRVDSIREVALSGPRGLATDAGSGGARFQQARRDYFTQRQCRPVAVVGVGAEAPAYLTSENTGNRIPADRISPNHSLVHLASLNALLRRALSGGYGAADLEIEIESLTGRSVSGTPDAATIDRIASAARSAGEEWVRHFSALISEALGPTEPHWWAAFAYEVDERIEGDDWTEAAVLLGLGHLNTGDWMMSWRYSPQVAGPLYRPTVLETADNSFHFPSHPGEAYGITMPLAEERPLIRELVHAPLKGDICAESCIGRLGRIEQPLLEVNNDTELDNWYRTRRGSHRRRLMESSDTTPVRNWMLRHEDRA